jgi:hypothetical protein
MPCVSTVLIAVLPDQARAAQAAVRDEAIDDAEVIEERPPPAGSHRPPPQRWPAGPPAGHDLPRARDRRTATALASYLSTAGFTDWDMEVLGLDLYI